MQTSEKINEIVSALSKAQKEIKHAEKNQVNPFFNNSSYSNLMSIVDACKKQLGDNGLAVIQGVDFDDEKNQFMLTRLAHISGQWFETRMLMNIVKSTPQEMGSLITYYRRYGLAAITGVAPDDDDDAEKAMKRNKPKPKKKAAKSNDFYCLHCKEKLHHDKENKKYVCRNKDYADENDPHTDITKDTLNQYLKEKENVK